MNIPTYQELEDKVLELAVQLANAESKCRELAEFKSRVYAQMGTGCEAPEFSITEGLSNLRRFADTLHAIEREFFTKEVPDEECEGETVEECPLCWGMTVEQYVSEFGKCLAEVRAQGVEMYADTLARGADDAECDGHEDCVKFLRAEAKGVREFAAQVRNGAAHHCSHCGGIDTCSEHGCTATDQMIERYRASKGAAL
ncbi:eae-like domain protein [Citrobacter portucalensis]|uniref:eae-like domain protein n=1 Tax=Citrobacter portucalensis TaxID=1639133 RepID=UPI00226B0D84|nr:eae-like domain protein [Citrobacter portucalensis]MCX9039575.1 eae-like domain protein [Citrobacter portucalensis]